jgi:hypothetical protein
LSGNLELSGNLLRNVTPTRIVSIDSVAKEQKLIRDGQPLHPRADSELYTAAAFCEYPG